MTAHLRCPVCNFTVFNRRVPRCEKCGNDLPQHLLFGAKELALLAEEDARIQSARRALQREKEEEERKREARRGSGG